MSPAEHVVCLVTCPADSVDAIALAIVEGRHAACVNVIAAVDSVYRWDGEVTTDRESLLVIKTTVDRVAALDALLAEIHPYDVHELIATPIVAGSQPYLDWISDSV